MRPNQNIVSTFKSNRDAHATNRGFYFQYLTLLEKWLSHFINGSDVKIQTEVEEDIKEIGDQLVFTQVKSYSSSFSINSEEIKSSLFNFYILYLEYHDTVPDLTFVFLTNSSVRKKEEILTKWIADPTLINQTTHKQTSLSIKQILKRQFTSDRNKFLNRKGVTQAEKETVKAAHRDALTKLEEVEFDRFLLAIKWQFGQNDASEEIKKVESRIASLLENPIFKSLPIEILTNRLLTEIYKRSTFQLASDRWVDRQLLSEIIDGTTQDIEAKINVRLIELLGSSYFKIISVMKELQTDMVNVKHEINEIKKNKPAIQGELPKELTTTPKIFDGEIIGRDDDITTLNDLLQKDHLVIVTGDGGIGKSNVVKALVKEVSINYEHLIWISGSNGLRNGLLYNTELLQALRLDNSVSISMDEKIQNIILGIKTLKGKTLVIIDDLSIAFKEDLKLAIDTVSGDQIDLIISTRGRSNGYPSFEIKTLSHNNAVAVIKKHCPSQNIDETEITEFLKTIEYNTLMIVLSAKTVEYSLDLTFSALTAHFRNNELDIDKLNIEIPSDGSGPNTRILSQLISAFKLNNLPTNELYTLQQLSLLPSEFLIEDFILLHGKDFYEQNREPLLNIFNSLAQKGWITRDKKIVRIHKLTQLAVRHQITHFAAVTMFFNNYLAYRLKENNEAHDYTNLAFVLLAEAWLKAIHKKDREAIAQPLILLESNLLVAYRQLGDNEKYIQGIIALAEYAESIPYLEDLDLGLIYNNVAIAYVLKEDHKTAIEYSEKAINLLQNDEKKNHRYLIAAIDSLTAMLLDQGIVSKATQLLKRAFNLRKQYLSQEDAVFAVQLNNIGAVYLKLNMLDESIEVLKLAIDIHNRATTGKNELMHGMYLCNLSINYLFKNDLKNAELHQLKAISILEGKGAPKNEHLLQCYKLMAIIYNSMTEPIKANLYEMKFNRVRE